MEKTLEITSGKGFKYTEEEAIFENSETKITLQCKHVPHHETGLFHHLELLIKKYHKKRSQDSFTEKPINISLTTKDKYNNISDNSVKLLFQILEAQRELVFKQLPSHAKLLIGDNDGIESIISKIQTKEISQQVLKILLNKSDLELSDLIKLNFTTNKIEEKKKQLKVFEQLIEKPNVKEVAEIQKYLSTIPWIFGAEYRKLDVRNAGNQIPDRRLKRIDGLSDILEIKLPNSELLRKDNSGRLYISPALSKAIGQLIGYLEYYNSQFTIINDDESGEEKEEDFYGRYYKPKGILLIGRRYKKDLIDYVTNTTDATPKNLRKTISYFHWLEILTYDDLIERAYNSLEILSSKDEDIKF